MMFLFFTKKKVYKRSILKNKMVKEKEEKKKRGESAGKEVTCGKCMTVVKLNFDGHCPSCAEDHNA